MGKKKALSQKKGAQAEQINSKYPPQPAQVKMVSPTQKTTCDSQKKKIKKRAKNNKTKSEEDDYSLGSASQYRQQSQINQEEASGQVRKNNNAGIECRPKRILRPTQSILQQYKWKKKIDMIYKAIQQNSTSSITRNGGKPIQISDRENKDDQVREGRQSSQIVQHLPRQELEAQQQMINQEDQSQEMEEEQVLQQLVQDLYNNRVEFTQQMAKKLVRKSVQQNQIQLLKDISLCKNVLGDLSYYDQSQLKTAYIQQYGTNQQKQNRQKCMSQLKNIHFCGSDNCFQIFDCGRQLGGHKSKKHPNNNENDKLQKQQERKMIIHKRTRRNMGNKRMDKFSTFLEKNRQHIKITKQIDPQKQADQPNEKNQQSKEGEMKKSKKIKKPHKSKQPKQSIEAIEVMESNQSEQVEKPRRKRKRKGKGKIESDQQRQEGVQKGKQKKRMRQDMDEDGKA